MSERQAASVPVRVRAARPGDEHAIWTMILEFARFERMESFATGSAERLSDHLFGQTWPKLDGLIAEAGAETAGYSLYFGSFSTFWARPLLFLEDLFVREAFRGRGVGQALMAEVARIGLERGCARMDWVVLDWNHPAVRFYESLGATRGEGWHNYQLAEEKMQALVASVRGSSSSKT